MCLKGCELWERIYRNLNPCSPPIYPSLTLKEAYLPPSKNRKINSDINQNVDNQNNNYDGNENEHQRDNNDNCLNFAKWLAARFANKLIVELEASLRTGMPPDWPDSWLARVLDGLTPAGLTPGWLDPWLA